MVPDLFAHDAGLIVARRRMRLTLAALVINMVVWSYSPYPHLVAGAVVLLLALLFLGRRRALPSPPWTPPWQRRTRPTRNRRAPSAAPARRPRRTRRASSVRRALAAGLRRSAGAITTIAAAIVALPARLRKHGARWAQTLAAIPARRARPAPVAPTMLPGVVSALTAATEQALADAGVAGQVSASESTPRAITLTLQTTELSAAQTRHIRTALRVLAPAVRWTETHRLSVPLPLARSLVPDPVPPCVPILRRRAMTLWWPLTETHPLILAGDALPTLHALLDTLAGSPGLLLYDPEQTLTAHSLAGDRWPAHTPDALASACAHALRTAYCRTHQPNASLPAPLMLVVVAPDAEAWRDLASLLARPDDGGVRLILALTVGASHPAAQDACRRGAVVEIGALGRTALPEACRPPGLAAPRPGMVLAWQTPQRHWRGLPIRRS
jgi:hypothetical protein